MGWHAISSTGMSSAAIKYTTLKLVTRGRIFSSAQPFYEWTVSDLDRSMHRSLWVLFSHSSFIEGLHTTKNTASVHLQTVTVTTAREKMPFGQLPVDQMTHHPQIFTGGGPHTFSKLFLEIKVFFTKHSLKKDIFSLKIINCNRQGRCQP
jgi:hypothetical protein